MTNAPIPDTRGRASRGRWTLRGVLACVCAATLVLAACTSGGDGVGDSTATPVGDTTATTDGGTPGTPATTDGATSATSATSDSGTSATSDGETAAAPADRPPGDPPQTVTSADVDAAIAQIPAEAEVVLEETGVPGMAITIVFEDEVVYAEGFGVREVGGEDAVNADTVFQLASFSKPISATVAAGLIGQGDVEWDDAIVEYLPDFELSDPTITELVTIADAYSHRTGLPDHAGDLLEDLGYDGEAVIERLRLLPVGSFRNSYAYTNFGLTTGAEAAATAAGTTWPEAADEVLFGPAGMENSSYRFEDYLDASDRAIPHVRDDDGNWVVTPDQRDPDQQAPAGGASSTATDLGQWLRIQLNEGLLGDEQIVDSDALTLMHTAQIPSKPLSTPSAHTSLYGLGIGVGVRDDGYTSWSHSGAFLLGTGTTVAMIPGQELGVAVITNGQPVGAAEAMAEIILDLIVDGEVSRDWLGLVSPLFENFYVPQTPTDWSVEPDDPADPQDPSVYVGTYGNSYYGPLEVSERDGGLVMILGPDGDEFPLDPYDGDTFLFTPPGENSLGPTGIVFTVEDDQAVSVNAEYYDDSELGTWLRDGDGATDSSN